MSGNSVYLKLENLQRTGAFKERGALNKLLTLTGEERLRGVIAASAGNHSQGLAYHASRLGIRSYVCMPRTTPSVKLAATRAYGAEVELCGADYDEACEKAVRRSLQEQLTFIHPFDDDAVIAGQGTLGLEIIQQQAAISGLLVPVGGGGLIAGVACAVKETNPRMRVIGVEAARLPAMKAAMQEGRPLILPTATTIADGIAVRRAGERTFALVQKYVDDIVTVEEEEIAQAIMLLLEREKTLAEGAGAVALAALLCGKVEFSGKKLAVLVSGGNIELSLLAAVIGGSSTHSYKPHVPITAND
jgi:threonine dehydratase